jgi:hypothetical protein
MGPTTTHLHLMAPTTSHPMGPHPHTPPDPLPILQVPAVARQAASPRDPTLTPHGDPHPSYHRYRYPPSLVRPPPRHAAELHARSRRRASAMSSPVGRELMRTAQLQHLNLRCHLDSLLVDRLHLRPYLRLTQCPSLSPTRRSIPDAISSMCPLTAWHAVHCRPVPALPRLPPPLKPRSTHPPPPQPRRTALLLRWRCSLLLRWRCSLLLRWRCSLVVQRVLPPQVLCHLPPPPPPLPLPTTTAFRMPMPCPPLPPPRLCPRPLLLPNRW